MSVRVMIEGCMIYVAAQLIVATYIGSFVLVSGFILFDIILTALALRKTNALEIAAHATSPSAQTQTEIESLTKILEIWTSKNSN